MELFLTFQMQLKLLKQAADQESTTYLQHLCYKVLIVKLVFTSLIGSTRSSHFSIKSHSLELYRCMKNSKKKIPDHL